MDLNPLQITLERRAKDLGEDSIINLIDSNFLNNGFVLPDNILRDGFETWLATRHYRPDPLGNIDARRAIVDFYHAGGPVSRPQEARGGGHRLGPEDIILTASSSESYNLLFQTFCQPGDNILIPQPGYPLFEDLASACHLETRFYPLVAKNDWEPDLDMIDLLSDARTRFLILISPNNPCGSLISDSVLERILCICEERGVMVISDEVFSEFLYLSTTLPRALAGPWAVPVFTLNGISKLFACPDLKLSWIAVSGPDTAPLMDTLALRNDNFLSCNGFSQSILPTLFSRSGAFVQGMVRDLAENRSAVVALAESIRELGITIRPPDAGIHGIITIPASTKKWDDETLAIRLVEEHGIYLHPGFLYGIDDATCLVFTILKEKNAFMAATKKLEAALYSEFR